MQEGGQRPGAHLFTEMHVGKAMPFSMVFPLKTLATALQQCSQLLAPDPASYTSNMEQSFHATRCSISSCSRCEHALLYGHVSLCA